jgi:hypothetical protein
VTASGATLHWYRFSDGSLVLNQTIATATGGSTRIDPRDVAGLPDNTQFAVVVDGTNGTVAAIVIELTGDKSPVGAGDVTYNTIGDNAMIYEGFPDLTTVPTPTPSPSPTPTSTPTPSPTASPTQSPSPTATPTPTPTTTP